MEVLFANVAALDFDFNAKRLLWNEKQLGRKPDDIDLRVCWFCLQLKGYVIQFPSRVADVGLVVPKTEEEQAAWNPVPESRHFQYLLCLVAMNVGTTGELFRSPDSRPEGIRVADALIQLYQPKPATLNMAALAFEDSIDHFRSWCTREHPFPGHVDFDSLVERVKKSMAETHEG